jgi:hypothetical protein
VTFWRPRPHSSSVVAFTTPIPRLPLCHCHTPRSSCREWRCVLPQAPAAAQLDKRYERYACGKTDVMLATFVGFVAMQSLEARDCALAFRS